MERIKEFFKIFKIIQKAKYMAKNVDMSLEEFVLGNIYKNKK